MKIINLIIMLFIIPAFLSACSSIVSKPIVEKSDKNLTISRVQSEPQNHIGKTVIWGGVIINTSNLTDSTEIEVLETGTDREDYPEYEISKSSGRFITVSKGYLDPVIFAPKKYITVAGIIKEIRKEKIGEMDYPYVVLETEEIHIFENYKVERQYNYSSPYFIPWPYGPYYNGPPPYFYGTPYWQG